ncbi:MAG: ATP-binding protein [Jatrophihabitans sp.]
MSGLPRRHLALGLQARVAATVLACVLLSSCAVALAAYLVLDRHSQTRFRQAAISETRADGDQVQQLLDSKQANRIEVVSHYLEGRYGLSWVALDYGPDFTASNDDAVRAAGGNDTVLSSPQIDKVRSSVDGAFLTLGGVPYMAVAADLSQGVVIVELYDLRPLHRELNDLRYQMSWIGIVVLLVAGLISLLLARRILRPVRLASAAARGVGSGDLSIRLPVRGRDELAELSGSFNDMTRELQRTLDDLHRADAQQRRFVADVSHELRTPLSSLVAAADAVDTGDPDVRRRAAGLLQKQSHRLAELVADLLEISRFDSGGVVFDPEPVDLGALTADAVATASVVHLDGTEDDSVHVVVNGEATVIGDPRRLHAVVRNMVGNAVQHGAPPIVVDVTGRADDVVVVVRDHGPGFPAELVPVAFDRFTRGDRARTNSTSNGLGLAIAAENARLHNATITINEPASGRGAEIRLTVPRRAG